MKTEKATSIYVSKSRIDMFSSLMEDKQYKG